MDGRSLMNAEGESGEEHGVGNELSTWKGQQKGQILL